MHPGQALYPIHLGESYPKDNLKLNPNPNPNPPWTVLLTAPPYNPELDMILSFIILHDVTRRQSRR